MTKALAVAGCLVAAGASGAPALELKDLLACKPAAIRLCDRSEVLSASALHRCATILALRHLEVGRACADVLRRYGALSS